MKKRKNNSAKKYPAIDFTKCIKCEKCIEVCPSRAIFMSPNYCCAKCVKYCLSMKVPCHPKEIIVSNERCTGCGICIDTCPEKAIYWSIPENN